MDLAEANLRDGAEIVSLGDKTITPDEYVYDFSFPKEAGHPNPHLWMNPMNARRYAEIIADTLATRDPANADYYQRKPQSLQCRARRTRCGHHRGGETMPEQNRKLLTYHDSWAYFAPATGLSSSARHSRPTSLSLHRRRWRH